MKRLIIVGAGGFGREALKWALDVPERDRDWEVAGFLDDNPSALSKFEYAYRVLGSPDDYAIGSQDVFVSAIGDAKTRLAVCTRLEERGGQFASIIHPEAIIGPHVDIGVGAVVCPLSIITCDIRVGKYLLMNLGATIGHDAVLGDACTLSCHCDVSGFGALGDAVFMGSHSCVAPGVKIGSFATLGAGAVAVREVPEGATVLGVPAKPKIAASAIAQAP